MKNFNEETKTDELAKHKNAFEKACEQYEDEIESTDIIAQLYLAIADYFEGDISLSIDRDAILYRLPSGEEFCIVAGRIS